MLITARRFPGPLGPQRKVENRRESNYFSVALVVKNLSGDCIISSLACFRYKRQESESLIRGYI